MTDKKLTTTPALSVEERIAASKQRIAELLAAREQKIARRIIARSQKPLAGSKADYAQ